MAKPRKVCVVITARPSYARVRTVLSTLRNNAGIKLQVIGTASLLSNRFGSAVNILRHDGFDLDWQISTLLEADDLTSAPKATALQLAELSTAFRNLHPDLVVTIADRYETLATAIAASYMNIPLAHIQGGEVTGNVDEKVRHAVTKLSDLHLVANDDARQRVARLGEREDTIFVTGCPSIDLAAEVVQDRHRYRFDPFDRYGGVGDGFDLNQPFLVIMQHPLTTHFAQARQEVTETLHAAYEIGMPVFCFWPNPDAGTEGASEAIRSFRETINPKGFHFFKNMEPHDFLSLLLDGACLVGNSSVGIREGSYLGVPVVNIGDRQAGRLRGPNVIDVPGGQQATKAAIERQLSNGRYPATTIYGDGAAGKRIAEILANVPLTFEKRITY
jgi:UDP-hydrolysing UDP-N-acetyl-D-glucosamine 2-epimerase